jgi:hypothetical protein
LSSAVVLRVLYGIILDIYIVEGLVVVQKLSCHSISLHECIIRADNAHYDDDFFVCRSTDGFSWQSETQ